MLKRWLVRWLGLAELEQRVTHLEVELPKASKALYISERLLEMFSDH